MLQLSQWIDANVGKPGFEEATRIHATIFREVENNLMWPFERCD